MFLDKDNENLGSINIVRETDGRMRMSLYVDNEDENENHLNSAFSIYVAKDDTKTYWLSNPANFREAITTGTTYANSKFFRADGELTNVLINKPFEAQYTSYDMTLANNGVSATAWPSLTRLLDKNKLAISYIGSTVYSTGIVATSLYAYNYKTDGTSAGNNYINLFMNKDGTKAYGIADPAAFRSAIGITKSTINCTPTSVMTGGSIGLYKYGQVVVAIFNNVTTSTISSRTQIATIPNSAYYPSHQAYGVVNGIADNTYFIMDTAGKIFIDKTIGSRWGWSVWLTN